MYMCDWKSLHNFQTTSHSLTNRHKCKVEVKLIHRIITKLQKQH